MQRILFSTSFQASCRTSSGAYPGLPIVHAQIQWQQGLNAKTLSIHSIRSSKQLLSAGLVSSSKKRPLWKGVLCLSGQNRQRHLPNASSQEVPHEPSPWPGGPVPKSRWLPMLEGPFCPCSSPRPVKGRSQSLALRWTLWGAVCKIM